jgi:glycosyltransferase involved in cell wall biosynthesis
MHFEHLNKSNQKLTMNQKKPKLAIVHHWLLSMRGGEKVIEEMCQVWPDADIFTIVSRPDRISETIRAHKITNSFIQKIPKATSIYQNLLPLMPLAIEQFNLNQYDIVISSDTNVTKGVLTRPNTLHVCYCNTPMRYAWDMYHNYLEDPCLGRIKKWAMRLVMSRLRVWDLAASNRVDRFIGNSKCVRNRIQKHYRRESEVIYPPVDVDSFQPKGQADNFYLVLGQIIPYKRIDIAVEAFNQNGKKLVIIGEGSELARLKKISRPNITFLGFAPLDVIRDHYQRCKAFIFPGEEDFGITPLEAQACGRPVLAFGRGGALETVQDETTGLFFSEQTSASLQEAIDRFESNPEIFSVEACVKNAKSFSSAHFRRRIQSFVEDAWKTHQAELLKDAPGARDL